MMVKDGIANPVRLQSGLISAYGATVRIISKWTIYDLMQDTKLTVGYDISEHI